MNDSHFMNGSMDKGSIAAKSELLTSFVNSVLSTIFRHIHLNIEQHNSCDTKLRINYYCYIYKLWTFCQCLFIQ